MKKVLAVILAITIPVWFIPAFFTFVLYMAFIGAYEAMLELLGE